MDDRTLAKKDCESAQRVGRRSFSFPSNLLSPFEVGAARICISTANVLIQALQSLFIIAADTWLHVSTKSVPMLYFADVDPTEAGAAYRFSRALVEDCRDEEGRKLERNSTLPCSVYDSGARLRALHPETIDSILLNNLESSDTIHRDNLTHLSFIGGPSRTSWSFGQRGQSLAPCFNASTFALNFTCSLVQNCRPQDVSQGNGTSRCGAGFSQANIGAWFKLMPWSNPRNYTGDELWSLADDWVVYAPYPSFHIEPGDERLIVNGSSMPVEGSSSFVLRCSPHFFTIKYTWANDTLTKLLAISKADETLRDILRGPLLSDYPYNDDHLTSFAKRLNIPSGGANHPKPYYTQEYAILLSDIGLSFLGGSIEARPAFGLQVQNETIVTQVPKTALFVLIFCNLWYAFTGFCLFLLACYITAYGDKAPDVRAVQELFTVIGLTTAAVSTARSFQNGDLRIGVEKLEDNWRFKVWGHHTDNADVKHCAADEELGLRLKPKDIKSPPVVEVVSIGSTDPGEGGEDVVSTRDDTESRHARAIDDGPVSPVSILEGSILGDDDQMQKRLLQSSDDAHLDSMSADRSTSST